MFGEQVDYAGDVSLPKLDHNQPPEHTQLLCLLTALVSAARQMVNKQHLGGGYAPIYPPRIRFSPEAYPRVKTASKEDILGAYPPRRLRMPHTVCAYN